jgi:hypothetical protein
MTRFFDALQANFFVIICEETDIFLPFGTQKSCL